MFIFWSGYSSGLRLKFQNIKLFTKILDDTFILQVGI